MKSRLIILDSFYHVSEFKKIGGPKMENVLNDRRGNQ